MKNKANNKQIGQLGEDLACRFLVKHGFRIVERNYWKKWGEIDIVAQKNKRTHFVEVKSVSCLPAQVGKNLPSVSGPHLAGEKFNKYRPEDNLHPWKLQRLSRTIQTYLLEREVSLIKHTDEIDWQFDVITIYIDMKKRISRVSFLEDIIL